MSDYLTAWRVKNSTYGRDFMRFKRKYYFELWKAGKVKYDDIPKSYRYWKNDLRKRTRKN